MKNYAARMLSVLMGGVLLFSAAGCGKSSEGSVRDVEDGAVTTVTTHEPKKAELHSGVVGEEVSYKDVNATLEHAYLPSYTFTEDDKEIGLIFFQISIQNNGEEALTVDMLSRTFGIETDNEAYPGISVRGPRFICKQFGEDAEVFYDAIQPGETREGYVCVEVPAEFQKAKLMYFPRAGVLDWDEAFVFEIAREDMEPAPDPVEPF